MNHWPFIIGAYGVALLGTAGLGLWSLFAMLRAERQAASLDK